MSGDGGTSTWLTIIPELYYDLIARVIPGGLFISTCFISLGALSYRSFTPGELGLPILMPITSLAGAYVLGLFFESITELVPSPLFLRGLRDAISLNRDVVVSFAGAYFPAISKKLSSNARLSRGEAWSIYTLMQDYVAHKDQEAGVVIRKMLAETTLCSSSVAALLLVTPFWVVTARFHSTVGWPGMLGYLFLLFLALQSTKVRDRVLVLRTITYLAILERPALRERQSKE